MLIKKTIIPLFYTSQASTNQPLCFKRFIMASYLSVVNINIIMKFLIGHKAFVSLCTTLPYLLISFVVETTFLSLNNSADHLTLVWARWLKRQGAWLRAGRPGFDPGCRRSGDFSSLLLVQTGPGVHSTSYKMSTGEFLRG